ncbi:MAG: hypothetical protein HY655_05165 [Acidobacteria bacterium]|nr:hypothetical protein [Acidobacteriota bacterium]
MGMRLSRLGALNRLGGAIDSLHGTDPGILFKYEYGEDVNEVFNMRPFYDQLTVSALRDAGRAYLDTNRYVEVTLQPESR